MIECAKAKGYQAICFNKDTILLRDDLYYKYEYFRKLKNDVYTLWMSAFTYILDENDRKWLINFRYTNATIQEFESTILAIE